MSRLPEIGILKAIGATRMQILSTFALEGILVAAIGGVVGAAAGSGLSYGLRHLGDAVPGGRRGEPFPIHLDVELLLGAIALAVLVGFLASLYPAWRAARVNPIEVVRGA
jgi:ABC-type lipoprotein release transport system permease subunit